MKYLVPSAKEFQVNTVTPLKQEDVAITHLSDGGFVIAWEQVIDGGSLKEIRMQRYDADGDTVGNNVRVNTVTDVWQAWPDLIELADGSLLVTWDIEYGVDYVGDVQARLFDQDGTPKGDQFTVNTKTNDDQWGQKATALDDGGFLIVWYSKDEGPDTRILKAQRFDEDGQTVGSEYKISGFQLSGAQNQSSPAITTLADGRVLVTWQEWIYDDATDQRTKSASYGRILDEKGKKDGPVFEVLDINGLVGAYSVAALENGGFVVVGWHKTAAQVNSRLVQMFDEDGNPVGDVDKRSGDNAGDHIFEPRVAELPDGGFVVTSTYYVPATGETGEYQYTLLERFDADGELVEDTRVNKTTGEGKYDDDADVAVLKDGRIVVSWESWLSDGSEDGVVARIFDAKMVGTSGRDKLQATKADDEMFGRGGNDKLYGVGGKDTIEGGSGNDKLLGGSGKDVLNGGKGDDALSGGKGNDKLTGGGGEDEFVFNKGGGKDVVTDFQNNVDTLVLNDNLWNGDLSVRKVINKYASVDGDNIVFDFGKHELTVKDFTNLNGLRDDIDIV